MEIEHREVNEFFMEFEFRILKNGEVGSWEACSSEQNRIIREGNGMNPYYFLSAPLPMNKL